MFTDGTEKEENPFIYGKSKKINVILDMLGNHLHIVKSCSHVRKTFCSPRQCQLNSCLFPCLPSLFNDDLNDLISSADYESLRIGGLAFAVVLFALGILLILSELTSVFIYL